MAFERTVMFASTVSVVPERAVTVELIVFTVVVRLTRAPERVAIVCSLRVVEPESASTVEARDESDPERVVSVVERVETTPEREDTVEFVVARPVVTVERSPESVEIFPVAVARFALRVAISAA